MKGQGTLMLYKKVKYGDIRKKKKKESTCWMEEWSYLRK